MALYGIAREKKPEPVRTRIAPAAKKWKHGGASKATKLYGTKESKQ